jgi:hypothetical protein
MQTRLASEALTRVLEGLVMRVRTFRALPGCVMHAIVSARVERCDVLAFEPIEHYTQACFPGFDRSWIDSRIVPALGTSCQDFQQPETIACSGSSADCARGCEPGVWFRSVCEKMVW